MRTAHVTAVAAVLTSSFVALGAHASVREHASVRPWGFEVVDARDGVTLLAADRERGPEATDVRPPREFLVVEAGVERAAPVPVWDAALLSSGVAWVTAEGALWLERASGQIQVIEESGVLPELAVSTRGDLLAYAKRPGDGAGVFVFDGDRATCVTDGLAFADRPLFVDDTHLIVVGAVPSGVAGVHVARVDGRSAPRAVTNADLRTGSARGRSSFVPPPARHDSMRVEIDASGAVLTYFDGRGTQRVALAAEVLR